jgi:tetratricopeptide (TPR) repeat protein
MVRCLLFAVDGPDGRSRGQTEQGLKGDPLDLRARINSALSLISLGRLTDAQAALHKVLELEENNGVASYFLAVTYALQEKWTEALHFAEKSTPITPLVMGTLAGVLKRMGEVDRAEELIQKLMSGGPMTRCLGFVFFTSYAGKSIKPRIGWRRPLTSAIPSPPLLRQRTSLPLLDGPH